MKFKILLHNFDFVRQTTVRKVALGKVSYTLFFSLKCEALNNHHADPNFRCGHDNKKKRKFSRRMSSSIEENQFCEVSMLNTEEKRKHQRNDFIRKRSMKLTQKIPRKTPDAGHIQTRLSNFERFNGGLSNVIRFHITCSNVGWIRR